MKLAGAQAWRRSDSHTGGQKMKVRLIGACPRRRRGGYFFSGSLTLLLRMCCDALIDRKPLAMRPYEMPLSVGDFQRSVAVCIIAASTVCVTLLNCTFGVLRYVCTTNLLWQVLLGKSAWAVCMRVAP